MLINTELTNCPVCSNVEYASIGSAIDFEYSTCSNVFDYVRCSSCEAIYIRNRPSIASLNLLYPNSYHNYSKNKSINIVYKFKNFIDRFYLRKYITSNASSFLDIGCCNGRLLSLAKSELPNNALIEGVEISESAASFALDQGFNIYFGSIESIKLKNDTYDLVYMQQVIEHLFNPKAALLNIRDSMKVGGRLIIETPTSECLDFKIFHSRYWGGFHCPRHLLIFSSTSIKKLASDCGFIVESISFKPQPVHWIWSIHHYLLDKMYPKKFANIFHMTNFFLVSIFTSIELVLNFLGFKTSNMCVVLKKPY